MCDWGKIRKTLAGHMMERKGAAASRERHSAVKKEVGASRVGSFSPSDYLIRKEELNLHVG